MFVASFPVYFMWNPLQGVLRTGWSHIAFVTGEPFVDVPAVDFRHAQRLIASKSVLLEIQDDEQSHFHQDIDVFDQWLHEQWVGHAEQDGEKRGRYVNPNADALFAQNHDECDDVGQVQDDAECHTEHLNPNCRMFHAYDNVVNNHNK